MARTEVIYMAYPVTFASIKPKRRRGNGTGLMATAKAVYHSSPRWSLNDLSPEVLVLIFKQLRDIDAQSLADARRISKIFDAIVTPIQLETLCLNDRIVAPPLDTHSSQFLEKVYLYTRHVETRSNLDPEGTRKILDKMQRLSSLRWHYVGTRSHSRVFSTPADILSPKYTKVNGIRLYIENLPLRNFGHDLQDTYLRMIPPDVLVSLNMTCPILPLTTRLRSLKQLLLKARQIETFHLRDRGQGTRFSFEGDERLPAFEDLFLRSYDWDHSADVVQNHWDFSRLRRLTLVDVPLFQFLRSVPYAELRQLHTLHLEDFNTHLPDRCQEATESLYMLMEQIRALRSLKVTCHTSLFPVGILLRHAASLQELSFRDYVGFGDEGRRCPTMQVEDLTLLSRGLVNLFALELDMDTAALGDPSAVVAFLRALCEFPRLGALVLHTQTVLRVPDGEDEGDDDDDRMYGDGDSDYGAATQTFMTLVDGKRVASKQAWKSITINVGGWRPVMVRRLGEAWRERNRRGVFAERCFVLEMGACDGEMVIREELGVDNSRQ